MIRGFECIQWEFYWGFLWRYLYFLWMVYFLRRSADVRMRKQWAGSWNPMPKRIFRWDVVRIPGVHFWSCLWIPKINQPDVPDVDSDLFSVQCIVLISDTTCRMIQYDYSYFAASTFEFFSINDQIRMYECLIWLEDCIEYLHLTTYDRFQSASQLQRLWLFIADFLSRLHRLFLLCLWTFPPHLQDRQVCTYTKRYCVNMGIELSEMKIWQKSLEKSQDCIKLGS